MSTELKEVKLFGGMVNIPLDCELVEENGVFKVVKNPEFKVQLLCEPPKPLEYTFSPKLIDNLKHMLGLSEPKAKKKRGKWQAWRNYWANGSSLNPDFEPLVEAKLMQRINRGQEGKKYYYYHVSQLGLDALAKYIGPIEETD